MSPDLPALIRRAQARLLEMHFNAKIGHIGGNLSSLDALLVLHHSILGEDDVFVLSKGHGAGALYVALWSKGAISDDQLNQFHQDGVKLAGHPSAGWHPEIRFATGSLGHGLGLAAGTALSRKLQGRPGRIFCLMSDGEWQEGSVWESLIFTAHHRLDNLTVLIDLNGLQGFGSTREVASMQDLQSRIQSFQVDTETVDGHDPQALLGSLQRSSSRPRFLLMKTVKGHGVSFMENRMEWHYLPLDESHYRAALRELDA
ncbi:MAG TPA: transketolase [bacterium]|jgi:transketolase|nr:transketolase [bacterium]